MTKRLDYSDDGWLRDAFAAAALQGMLAHDGDSPTTRAARDAYSHADAMMVARGTTTGPLPRKKSLLILTRPHDDEQAWASAPEDPTAVESRAEAEIKSAAIKAEQEGGSLKMHVYFVDVDAGTVEEL